MGLHSKSMFNFFLSFQQQTQITYRPEDDEWVDPEREFGSSGRAGKAVADPDDKLLLMVAPGVKKLGDISDLSHLKEAKEKAAKEQQQSSGGRGWSKIEAEAKAEPEPEPEPQPVKEPEPEPVKAPEPAPVEQPPANEGVYVPRHRRLQQEGAAAGPPSPRNQSPASKPAPSANAPEPGSYIPPALRRQMQADAAAAPSAPSPFGGPSRPSGSGMMARQQKTKVMPDLKSADEFPSLG